MKNLFIQPFRMIEVILLTIFLSVPAALADDPEARRIMQQVEDRDDGDNQTALMEMILISKSGNRRLRKIATFGKDKGEDTLRLMFFQHPADVKDTAFLTWDFDDPDKDDDQWLYLPAQKKSKRIASSNKSSSFMGSDLNYSDMTSRNLVDYDYTFYKKKEMDVRGVKTWVIKSIPRSKKVIDETGYKESLLFIRQDIFFVIRAVHREKTGGVLKYMDVKTLEQIDGIWVATEMQVYRKKGKRKIHETILKWHDVKFNQNLDEDVFTVRRMEKGL
jgi:hypothetical protein